MRFFLFFLTLAFTLGSLEAYNGIDKKSRAYYYTKPKRAANKQPYKYYYHYDKEYYPAYSYTYPGHRHALYYPKYYNNDDGRVYSYWGN